MTKNSSKTDRTTAQVRMTAAMNFIASQKSDPFAYGRVMTHMKNGIASFRDNGEDAFYSATMEVVEGRTTFTSIKMP